MRILGSDQSFSPPSQIPEQLREPLFGLIENRVKADAVAAATKKFSPDDTQTLVDVLDLVSIVCHFCHDKHFTIYRSSYGKSHRSFPLPTGPLMHYLPTL
jgi:hypothetical protein